MNEEVSTQPDVPGILVVKVPPDGQMTGFQWESYVDLPYLEYNLDSMDQFPTDYSTMNAMLLAHGFDGSIPTLVVKYRGREERSLYFTKVGGRGREEEKNSLFFTKVRGKGRERGSLFFTKVGRQREGGEE